ncbi:WecB/TagA/CpsF family glycosyltransferase [Anaerophaga thermohalophila]|uniref:WecB/TagA/CpsF family glycosyltransferase n=1 Tax=Anaerophaga thermohalophila TaxID=177400 RepID=UPI000237CE03|nr:WecB/TagA/CpsF family glycosyltransferase [Anaerophaga thermohalophila]
MYLGDYKIYDQALSGLSPNKLLINTINAHSYNTSLKDAEFTNALQNSDALIPDGIGVVLAIRWLTGQKLTKIAGEDLFYYEMERLQKSGGKVFFLGSTEETLLKIKERAHKDFPNVELGSYSPPYKQEFLEEENATMIMAVNTFQPDVLFIGMTAPKQEKWAYKHFKQLKTGHVCCIGAVFDFYAGTVKRAPKWMIKYGMEWFYRFAKEPKRLWYRYLIGNIKFVYYVCREKFFKK